MADLSRIMEALRAADAAGDTEASTRLAQLARDAQGQSGSILDPTIVERGMVLPVGRTAAGETEFALPGFAADIVKAVELPGRAVRGEEIAPEEITQAALAAGAPALRGVSGAAKSVAGKSLTRAEIKGAPTPAQLKKQSNAFYKAAGDQPDVVSANEFADVMGALEQKLFDKGFNPRMHKKTRAAFSGMTDYVGQDVDMKDLQIIREFAKDAAASLEKRDARFGPIMKQEIDAFIDTLPHEGGRLLREGEKAWKKYSTSKTLKEAVEAAKDTASGFENGIRIEFRKILKNRKKSQYLTSEEKEVMQAVVRGSFGANALKKIGKLGVGSGQQSNQLMALLSGGAGGGIGTAIGGPVGGAVGFVAAPAVGTAAGKGAETLTRRAAERATAHAAGARPGLRDVTFGRQAVQRTTLAQALAQGYPLNGE